MSSCASRKDGCWAILGVIGGLILAVSTISTSAVSVGVKAGTEQPRHAQ